VGLCQELENLRSLEYEQLEGALRDDNEEHIGAASVGPSGSGGAL
jgi:hypothetical protein